jgi:hypothetical protein
MKVRQYTDQDLKAVVSLFTALVHGLTAAHYDEA